MTHPLQGLDGRTPLPPMPDFEPGIRRAPRRQSTLSEADRAQALANALRYIPTEHQRAMVEEFRRELDTWGRIYGYRFRPPGRIVARPIETYLGRCLAGKALQLMIDNNLDFETALYPYELVTYGETGQVCQNWMQYRWIQHDLARMTEDQTLVVASGHPLGLFPAPPHGPRAIITNGLMVGMYDTPAHFARAAALGVANYGQMTAGGWMYIGPQGIVHGTYNTLIIAARKFLDAGPSGDLTGKLFVSSGLGGMSGAQGKAALIAGGVAIIAEVDPSRIRTRRDQGWITDETDSPSEAFARARRAQRERQPAAIAFAGNIVTLLEYAVAHNEAIDLISDQTSCHAVYDGGYCPVTLTFSERTERLASAPVEFGQAVDASLRRHFAALRSLVARGAYFFDYGNAFMKAVLDSGCKEIARNGRDEVDGFLWPSYVEDLLGPELFDFGYGPFRWVCLSGRREDLQLTDQCAARIIRGLRPQLRPQDLDNLRWVESAGHYHLVVGSQARILYQDALGRQAIARAFNAMVRHGEVGPIMLGRDHHDTGGTDSPLRETSNIRDGSNIMADMATHAFAGNAARGMTLVALHNGGGVGVGKSINGGFGLLLDGRKETDTILETAIPWDVLGGVARRAWARNTHALEVIRDHNAESAGRHGDASSPLTDLIHMPYGLDPMAVPGHR